ncbi:hypothetical protein ACFUGD_17315 [Streptomyces sp. NPDC057217]|uniref:hypothetical protein n=1 Tax=Streptomyces sp. NPDC057217 TaxID=3346054 RepID=UPI00363016E8
MSGSAVTGAPGPLPAGHVLAASVRDRDGARHPSPSTRLDHRGARKTWTYRGPTGRLVDRTARILAATRNGSPHAPRP